MAKETTRRRPARMPSEAERFAALRREAPVFQNASDDEIRAALAQCFEEFFADLDALIAADNPADLDLGELVRGDDGGSGPNRVAG